MRPREILKRAEDQKGLSLTGSQVVEGSVQDVIFGGRTFKVYKTPNTGYIAFVTTTNFSSGTVNLLEIIKWVMTKGWLSSKSTLNQICFGVETVSTDDTDARFQVTGFSIDEKLGPGIEPTAPANDAANEGRASNHEESRVRQK